MYKSLQLERIDCLIDFLYLHFLTHLSFQKVLENFEGELIELVDENENEEANDIDSEGDDEGASVGGDSDDSGEKE